MAHWTPRMTDDIRPLRAVEHAHVDQVRAWRDADELASRLGAVAGDCPPTCVPCPPGRSPVAGSGSARFTRARTD